MTVGPRIALLGIHLEANAFAPVTTGADFRASCYFEGGAMLAEAAQPAPAMPAEIPGFVSAMDAAGPWQPLPILLTSCEPGGPADADFLRECLDKIRRHLRAVLPLDAVYISNHGAMAATDGPDPDGELFEEVRGIVGATVPIVATLDLHANISERMVRMADAIISYRTNPHVDQRERAADAAALLRRLLAGLKLRKAFIRMPLVGPSVRLLTAEGPYADLIDAGQRQVGGDVPLVSVVGGFAWSDLPKNGIAIITYGNAAISGTREVDVALGIARQAWTDRERFQVWLTSLDDAIARTVRNGENTSLPPVCLADVADNPGGGGRGNTTDILEGLIAAGARGVLFGLFVDAALADACRCQGVGAEFEAAFNDGNADEHGRRVLAKVRVLSLSDGNIVGRRGIARGRLTRLGPSAAIALAGLTIVVASRRIQAADPAYFETFGLDIAAFRSVVLKSRGHFRAGFDEFFKPDQILEVDAGGLVSPILSRFPFRHLPQPIYPLDANATWVEPVREAVSVL